MDCIVRWVAELDTTEQLSFFFFFFISWKNMEHFTNLHVILAQGPC